VIDTTIIILIISLICAALALRMLLAKDALTCALSLLGILLGTAAIYGLMGEHFIATIQLVVYAGAIMVLFVFSVMLLNLHQEKSDFSLTSSSFLIAAACMILIFGVGAYALSHFAPEVHGLWNLEKIAQLGGNTKVLAHELFSRHFIALEAVSIALLIALIGGVSLAKRTIKEG
jgi:NADH-quinone oxidoreductase subunit J